MLDKSKYAGLQDYSDTGGTIQREPGRFKAVYITGEEREGEEQNKLQVLKEWQDDSPTFVLKNQDSINFIILFIKKFRSLNQQDGRTICFNYTDKVGSISSSGRSCPPTSERNNGFCNNCRFQYVIAGVLLDQKLKPILDENDKPYLVYFRNARLRYSAAADYINELNEKTKELDALTDDPAFEAAVVTPRRFITQVTRGTRQTDYGKKNVFKYAALKQLPDKAVGKILEDSENLREDFDKQFDVSRWISKPSESSSEEDNKDMPKFEETKNPPNIEKESKEKKTSPETEDDLNLDDLDLDLS